MLTLEDFSASQIIELINKAELYKNGLKTTFDTAKYLSLLFFENSTRTKISFEMAARKLGIQTIAFDVEKSSVNKGENLYDTVKTLESIGLNAVVIRHPQNEFYKELTDIKIPIINAGDGTGNHPSQTVLDLMTIKEEFGHIKNLKIAIVGDIKHSRVANSLSQTLIKMGAEVHFSGPEMWFGQDKKHTDLDSLIDSVDVLYLLRIQHERHKNENKIENYLENYGLTKKREKKMKQNAIIMHPAPINRGIEIDSALVECARSRIFTQMKNGVYARMAILDQALNGNKF